MSDLIAQAEYETVKAVQAAFTADRSLIQKDVPRFLELLRKFDQCMRTNQISKAMQWHDRCDTFAAAINGGNFGLLTEYGAATLLEEAAAAPAGEVPMWGQQGSFALTVKAPRRTAGHDYVRVRFEVDGVFGIGSPFGFSIHAVDLNKPFFSETGYRSFVGAGMGLQSVPLGFTVADYCTRVLLDHFTGEMKSKLVQIEARWFCDSCGKRARECECEEFTSRIDEFTESPEDVAPVAVAPIAAEPEQLSLF